MERLFPGAAGHIAEAAEALGTDAGCLDALAERLYETARAELPPLHALRRGPLARAPEGLARRVLRRWFWEGAALHGPLRTSAPSATPTRWPWQRWRARRRAKRATCPSDSRQWRGGRTSICSLSGTNRLAPRPPRSPAGDGA